MTKVRIGPNGDQQRVFVEQEFSNEQEFNAFVRNLRHNFEKAFNHRSTNGQISLKLMKKIIMLIGKNPGQSSIEQQMISHSNAFLRVVVVEEPDEEPKIYQQQAYNANIESRKAAAAAAAAASVMTPPLTPTSNRSSSPSPPNPPHIDHQPSNFGRTRTSGRSRHRRYVSPVAGASRMSSSSTTRSHRRRRRNKMKYRRQPFEQQKDNPSSHAFHIPNFVPRYPQTPPPTSMQFQRRFYPHDPEMTQQGAVPPFQWVMKRIHFFLF